MGQPQTGMISKLDAAGISHNYLSTVIFSCLLHTQTDYRVSFRSVGAYNQHSVDICNAGYIITHRSRTEYRD
jgi:hypothetical protein